MESSETVENYVSNVHNTDHLVSNCTKDVKQISPSTETSEGNKFTFDNEGYLIVYTDGGCFLNGKPNSVAGFGVYFGPRNSL